MPIFVVAAERRNAEQVCDDCGEVEEWSPDGDQILYVTAGDPSGVGLLTIGASHNDDWLQHPGYGIYNPRLSSDGGWVAFNGRRTGWRRRECSSPGFRGRRSPARRTGSP